MRGLLIFRSRGSSFRSCGREISRRSGEGKKVWMDTNRSVVVTLIDWSYLSLLSVSSVSLFLFVLPLRVPEAAAVAARFCCSAVGCFRCRAHRHRQERQRQRRGKGQLGCGGGRARISGDETGRAARERVWLQDWERRPNGLADGRETVRCVCTRPAARAAHARTARHQHNSAATSVQSSCSFQRVTASPPPPLPPVNRWPPLLSLRPAPPTRPQPAPPVAMGLCASTDAAAAAPTQQTQTRKDSPKQLTVETQAEPRQSAAPPASPAGGASAAPSPTKGAAQRSAHRGNIRGTNAHGETSWLR